MKVSKPLVKLSICECGFPVLNETIGVGHVYTIDLGTVREGGRYFCGGCGTWKDIIIVEASQSSRPGMAILPYDLFVPVVDKQPVSC